MEWRQIGTSIMINSYENVMVNTLIFFIIGRIKINI